MSEMMDRTQLDHINEFYNRYCMDGLAELAQGYSKDTESLWIDWQNLNQYDAGMADDVINSPDEMLPKFREELKHVELPVDVDLSGAFVRFYNLPETHTYAPSELRNEHGGKYISIKGTLSRATGSRDRPRELVFECTNGHTKSILQFGNEKNEPSYCDACNGNPNWRILTEQGEWTNESKIKIETPPDETGAIDGDNLTGFVRDDLVDYGHKLGIAGRTGEDIIASGVVRREERTGRGTDALVFDKFLDVKAVEFGADESSVDIEAHKEEFTELSETENPIDNFAASIAPSLYATPEWERALEMGVAYLFGAPRIDIDGGPTYRGDIHMLIVSDYGMGKSTFNSGIAEFSPDCIKKSATGLGSHVGLTATAVQDDSFGDGGWILKPGILVRGNGGHVILDEIDKPDADLNKMNDALEKDQQVSVEKAGKDATFNSRVGLLATANPTDGRFDPNEPVGPQIGIDASLLSRFDGIITMRDTTDEEIDAKVGETVGTGYKEGQEMEFGEREELEFLDQPVPKEVGKAWIAYARENVHPIITDSQIEDLKNWYAEEIRQFNNEHQTEDTADPPIPVTARAVEDAIRVSVAFARVHLRETVADSDLERAKDLLKTLAGQTYDSDSGMMVNRMSMEHRGKDSQGERRENIVQCIAEEMKTIEQISEHTGIAEKVVSSDVDKLKQQGKIYEPQTGEYQQV